MTIMYGFNIEDEAFRAYQKSRIAHWNRVARQFANREGWGKSYHQRLSQIYRFLIPPGRRILELGCGQGNLLGSLSPSYGVGVDFSPVMVKQAQQRYPDFTFLLADVHSLDCDETFDVIILSDLVNDLWDVQHVLTLIRQNATARTRLIINSYSRLWETPLGIAQWLGLSKPNLQQNWLTVHDLENLLELSSFEAIRHWQEVLFPLPIPVINGLANRYLVKLWPFKHLALTNFIVARLDPRKLELADEASVSVIVPARNEAGNISTLFQRLPKMGRRTELILVEGHSTDNTQQAIEQEIANHPDWDARLYPQTGVGKGDAVRVGFKEATGEILMILDADLTVPPEDLVRFYDVIHSGEGEFINGVRLVYPMQDEAMRFWNLLGNKAFGTIFSWLLGQNIRDTLCGTKVLMKVDYEQIAADRAYFGEIDPFGDFDLLLGASKLNLRIIELPIRYRNRIYGTTNISRWRHGWLLLRMVVRAARRIKFV